MSTDDLSPPVEPVCWAVYARADDGTWWLCQDAIARTRSGAIAQWGRTWRDHAAVVWRAKRRAGNAIVVRVYVQSTEELP